MKRINLLQLDMTGTKGDQVMSNFVSIHRIAEPILAQAMRDIQKAVEQDAGSIDVDLTKNKIHFERRGTQLQFVVSIETP